MTRPSIVVTGGAGFIGAHLTKALLARGECVHVYDNLTTGKRGNIPAGASFVHADVLDFERLAEAVADASVVFHLAARVSVRASMDTFYEDAHVNLLGTLNLLRAIRGTRVRKVIFASSMAVYADADKPEMICETYPTVPVSPYGLSKLASEQYLQMIGRHLGVKVRILRYFNTYGPGQAFTPYVGVITIFINRLLAGQPPIVFGTGEQRRDFISVHDVVRATIFAMDWEGDSEVFNIGTGQGLSVREVAQMLIDTVRPGIRPLFEPHQAGEVSNSIADIARARQMLGFEPSIQFAEAIDEIIEDKRNASGVFPPH